MEGNPENLSPEQRSVIEQQRQENSGPNAGEISRQFRVVFLHGILKDATPQGNSLIKEGTPWQTKVKLALAIRPTLSVSTVQVGDTDREMWGRMGLIVTGGEIMAAAPRDIESRVQTLRQRRLRIYEERPIAEAIRKAIEERDQSEERRRKFISDYNEFTIYNPQFAGFYICADRMGDPNLESLLRIKDHPSLPEIIPFIQELALPLFIIQNGEVYRGIYGEEDEVGVVPGEKLSIDEILENQYQLPQPQKEEIVRELLDNPPFKTVLTEGPSPSIFAMAFGERIGNPENKIGFPDTLFVGSRYQGRRLYVELNALNNKVTPPVSYLEADERLVEMCRIFRIDIEEGDKVRLFGRVEESTSRVHEYVMLESSAGERNVFVGTGRGTRRSWDKFFEFRTSQPFIKLLEAPGRVEIIETGEIHSTGDYLKKMKELLNPRLSTLLQRLKFWLTKEEREKLNLRLKQLAFHAFGFGEQAGRCGDYETQKRAYEIASQALPFNEYKKIVSERVGVDGRFKLTAHDLQV